MSTAELATSYAALILADDGIEITVSDGAKQKTAHPTIVGARYWERTTIFVLRMEIEDGWKREGKDGPRQRDVC